ncbi:MAG: signal peptidase I [Candidatus Hydrogenedentes bacterium]|nr:signal peptidase I [Candidatus Hydrogenedentota bacterium]
MAKKNSKTGGRADKPNRKPGTGVSPERSAFLGAVSWFVGDLSRQNAIDWTKNIGIALAVAFMIRWPLAEPYKIPSQSMYPTLNGVDRFLRGDRVFVNKYVYGVRVPFMNKRLWRGADPQRWDIVVFQSPDPEAQHPTLIKRIVGLPGERIHIAHGKVYVNGEALELPPNMPPAYYTSPGPGQRDMVYGVLEDETHAVVPKEHYLMLGDNSGNSRDGRYFGWVPNENIVGKAFCIWWPIPRCRDFTGFTRTWWWRTIASVLGILLIVRLFYGRSWCLRHPVLGDTIGAGEHLYIHRAALGIPTPFTRRRMTPGRKLVRGEIVVYHGPPNPVTGEHTFAGRVAGLPGERVYLDNGKLTTNGAPLPASDPLAERTFSTDGAAGTYGRSKGKEYSEVPDGHYFVLCDDASGYPDSRTLGWIPRRDVIGVATAVWWPLSRLRRITAC